MISTKRRNWLVAGIIITTFLLIFLPGMVASGLVQRYIVGICGALSVLFQVLILTGTEMPKKYRTQSFVVLGLTVAAIVLMFMVYGR